MGPLIPYIKAPELPLSFLKYVNPLPIAWLCFGAAVVALLFAAQAFTEKRRNEGVVAALIAVAALGLKFVGPSLFARWPTEIHLFDPAHPPTIKPFGTLVAIGVYMGAHVALRHARERGLSEKKMNELIFWTAGGGFIGAHMLDSIFYHPDRLAHDPLYFFAIWDGLSSYGGFVGALIGSLAFRAIKKQKIFGYMELIASSFPLAWVFGRSGCATVHDHPGHLSDAWYAVQWPAAGGHYIGRLDLGLIEMVLTVPLAVAYAIAWHRKPLRPNGFYLGWMCVAYAPVRFVLDFLREDETSLNGGDPRYGGLTPAQWACFGLLGLGLYFLNIWRKGPVPVVEAEADEPSPGEAEADDETDENAEETAPASAPAVDATARSADQPAKDDGDRGVPTPPPSPTDAAG